jgi:pyruvate formate-lyase activating enzyme-like uncharacterized protein
MSRWEFDGAGSFYSFLPRGCEICRMGAGLVLFVTGLCQRSCPYCPLSQERKDKDAVFANERRVLMIEDVLEEARSIGALGTGITGGEPLMRLDLVTDYIKALKREFGPEHHIHLYTGILPDAKILVRLRAAGLDEIRFHPPNEEWSSSAGLEETLMEAKGLGMEAGVEIPAMGPAPGIIEAVRRADAFLNLNELEFSETNQENLRRLGFVPGEGCGAKGSEEIARLFMLDKVKVHYCPSRFKDAVQLRERLKRRAERVARPFDIPTEDGTLIHGTICGDLDGALRVLRDLGVPHEMYSLSGAGIDIAALILEDVARELKRIHCIISIVERYPLEDGLVVERIPL